MAASHRGVCAICRSRFGEDVDGLNIRRHTFSSLPGPAQDELRRQHFRVDLVADSRLCCRHFRSHHVPNFKDPKGPLVCKTFKKGYFPGLADNQSFLAQQPARPPRRRSIDDAPRPSPKKPAPAHDPTHERHDPAALKAYQSAIQALEAERARAEAAEKRVAELEASMTGVFIRLDTPEARSGWLGLGPPETSGNLCAELVAQLRTRSNHALHPLARLQALLFILRNGVSVNRLSRSVLVNGKPAERATLHNWVLDTLDELQPWCDKQINLLDPRTWHEQSNRLTGTSFEEYLLLAVDGTIIPVHNPGDLVFHKRLFQQKHNTTGFVFFILVTMSGHIVYTSKTAPGSTHDATHWEKSGVAEVLGRTYGKCVRVHKKTFKLGVCGDKAYPNISLPEDWHLFITKSGEAEVSKLAKCENVHFNPAIAQLRSVVERTFAWMKRFEILTKGSKIIGSPKIANKVVRLIAAITNRVIAGQNI